MIPATKICVACGTSYPYYKRLEYPGKSPRRCPECQQRAQAMVSSGNLGARPMGHRTRQQHKRVFPTKG